MSDTTTDVVPKQESIPHPTFKSFKEFKLKTLRRRVEVESDSDELDFGDEPSKEERARISEILRRRRRETIPRVVT